MARRGTAEYAALFGSSGQSELGPDSDADLLVESRAPQAALDVLANPPE